MIFTAFLHKGMIAWCIYVNYCMSRKKLTFILAISFTFLVLGIYRATDVHKSQIPIIQLETYQEVSAATDSDADAVPDWLEDLLESDPRNPSSFPYRKDVVRAQSLTVDDILYGGPGEFTEEIVRKFILGPERTSPVTADEKEKFIATSAAYFQKQADARGMPPVSLRIDDTVSHQVVLDDFLLSLDRFAGGGRPVDILTLEVFAKNTAVLPEAREMRNACEYTLDTMPRAVPPAIYDSYYLVLERVTYLCEALTIALTANTIENFFYAFNLMHSGKQFDTLEGEEISEGDLEEIFINAVVYIIESLGSTAA